MNKIVSFGGKEPDQKRNHRYKLESSVKLKDFKKSIKKFDLNILEEPVWTPDGDKPGVLYLREIIQDYLYKLRREGVPDVIGVETPFNFKIDDNTIVRGFMDRLDRIGPGEYRVVDYKTSKNKKYLTDFQLLVYAEAIRRKFSDVRVVHGSFILLKHNCESIDYVFNIDDLDRCNKLLVKKASFIDTDDTWVKKPSVLCRWCDYKPICQDAWAE